MTEHDDHLMVTVKDLDGTGEKGRFYLDCGYATGADKNSLIEAVTAGASSTSQMKFVAVSGASKCSLQASSNR